MEKMSEKKMNVKRAGRKVVETAGGTPPSAPIHKPISPPSDSEEDDREPRVDYKRVGVRTHLPNSCVVNEGATTSRAKNEQFFGASEAEMRAALAAYRIPHQQMSNEVPRKIVPMEVYNGPRFERSRFPEFRGRFRGRGYYPRGVPRTHFSSPYAYKNVHWQTSPAALEFQWKEIMWQKQKQIFREMEREEMGSMQWSSLLGKLADLGEEYQVKSTKLYQQSKKTQVNAYVASEGTASMLSEDMSEHNDYE